MSFRARVFTVLLGLVALMEGATYLAMLNVTRDSLREQSEAQLRVGARVFDNLLASRADDLRVAARVIAADFGFKDAATSGDPETMRSALANHSLRIGADLAMLIGLDGRIVASTLPPEAAPGAFPFPELFEPATADESHSSVVMLGEQAVQLVVTPLNAPAQIAWVAIGVAVDDALLERFRELTNLSISFIGSTPEGVRLLASSLPANERPLPLDGGAGLHHYEMTELAAAGSRYLALARPIDESERITAVLKISLARAMATYAELRLRLSIVFVLALALAVLAARALAATVTRPLRRLARASHRIARGDYESRVEHEGSTEIDVLAKALNDMQQGIRDRQARIVYQSRHDSLTGLPNRAVATDRLDIGLRHARRKRHRFALLMLDLNGFKAINDRLGHEIGDRVLKEFARRLASALRPSDAVARLGGDEFLIQLSNAGVPQARETAHRVLEIGRQPVALDEFQLRIDLSIGIAAYPEHGQEREQLMRRADIAMYAAKDSAEGIAVYRHGQDEDHLRRLATIADLRRALDENALSVVYQPKMSLAACRANAVEALVRWEHPELGPISPADFIPLAEQAGLINRLTHWMLEQVLAQVAEWRESGLDVDASVNISAHDLLDEHLPELTGKLLERHRLPAEALTLEITESAVMRDTASARAVMERLQRRGVRLSIDDFGTGHSSLAQLKGLPVDELKIDKSFVLNLDEDAEDAVIVRSTVELAHNMGLAVTAEGVESETSLELLRAYGCDVVQGFYLSRPLDPERATRWLERYRADGRDAQGGDEGKTANGANAAIA